MTAIFRFWKWIFCFLMISYSFVLDGVGQECNRERDSLALVDLYNATGGANWTNKWDLNRPMNTWFGVHLTAQGCVSALILHGNGDLTLEANEVGNNLSGTIPTSIGMLSELRTLNLRGSNLIGELPCELGELENLTGILLEDNQFSGGIPSSLGTIPALGTAGIGYLGLSNNQLSGCFPESLMALCDIQVETSGNPDLSWQGDFSRFCSGEVDLNCTGEEINCEIINNCRTRDSLALVALYNATNGANWTNIWNLTQPIDTWYGIKLNQNGCVDEIRLCVDCSTDEPSGNNLFGNLPGALGNLEDAQIIVIEHNVGLTGAIPTTIGNLKKTTFFSLSSNNLSGRIPNEIRDMSSLTDLRLGGNNLTGNIPPEIGQTPKLQHLFLDDNQLMGSIPEDLYNLDLIRLGLTDNQLTGSVSNRIGDLQNLVLIRLRNNQFSGTIPTAIGGLTNLESLYLNDNDFTGCFPDELLNICSLGFNIADHEPGYNFSNNPQLPWQGDFARFCNGENQIGAVCNDGDVNTSEDQIQEDCSCLGEGCTEPMNLGRITEVEQLVTCDENIFLEDIASASPVATYETNPSTVEVGISDSPGVFFDNLEIGINTINIISDTFNCTYYTPTTIELIRLTQPNLQEDRIGIDNTLSQHVFSVIENDDLIPNTLFTIEVVSPVSRGDLDNRRDGTFVYTPPANFTGVANFDYRLCYDDCMTYCDQATVLLDVSGDGLNDDGFTVPEAFTPNDDGVNDEFIIPALRDEPEKYPKNELIVINRWGDQVFYAKPYNNDWRGTNQKGKPLPAATYYYIIRLDISEGDIVRGEVTLIR